ncbi:hypothetical protein [Micromonospora costi]|uniref:hypothetical protein n=1 Tax=Micromonospora costi TaxID=1530042 RepID=UPI0011C4894F|nr:hypothetical protein [Micromonospora costi]
MDEVRLAAADRGGVGCSTRECLDRFAEVYLVPSWDEHLRQHGGRLTGAAREAAEGARHPVDGQPEVPRLRLPAAAGAA